MRLIIAFALAVLSGCASQPRDPQVLAYCSSKMNQQHGWSVGLFDHRFPCIIDERDPTTTMKGVLMKRG